MARNQIDIDGSIDDVFDVLRDPFSYADWVVGTREILEADESWPEVGSAFRFRVGAGRLGVEGTTRVLESEDPRRVKLETKSLPMGTIAITIEIHDREDGHARVTLDESSSAMPLLSSGFDVMLHLRNYETLTRLRRLVEGRVRSRREPSSLHALSTGRHWLEEPHYAAVLDSTDSCFLGIETEGGPHVIPVAFTYAFGRLWIIAERSSLKTRIADKRSSVGVLIRNETRSVVLRGRAEVLDLTQPWASGLQIVERLLAGPALVNYVRQHASQLLSSISNAPSAARDLNPLERVAIVVAPESLCLVEDDAIIDRRGPDELWPDIAFDAGDLHDVAGEDLDLEQVPDPIAALAEEDRAEAALGWQSTSGPVVLPARWHPQRSIVSTPAILLEGSRGGPIAMCLENSGDALQDLEGLVIRGTGSVVGSDGFAAIAIEQERLTHWSGADISTSP